MTTDKDVTQRERQRDRLREREGEKEMLAEGKTDDRPNRDDDR